AGETGHAHAATVPAASAAAEPAAAALPTLLDAGELELLKSLAEAIVPGSTEAGVAAVVGQPLAVATRARPQNFLGAPRAMQGEALRRYGKSWLSLDPAQQNELLTAASTAESSRKPRYWKPGEPVLVPPPPKAAPTLRDRFDLLKERIATAYY